MGWITNEYNDDVRTQSPRLSADRLRTVVWQRGVGPRDQEEQRNQRASFVAKPTSYERTQQAAVSHHDLVEKTAT